DTPAGGATANRIGTSSTLTMTANNPQAWNADFIHVTSASLNLGTGAVTLGGNRQVTVEANTLTVGGGIGDGGNNYTLTKAGTGTLVLNGSGAYGGNTFVTAGKVQVGAATALGTAAGYTDVASGAEVLFDGAAVTFTCSEPFRVSGVGAGDGGVITVQNSATPTFSGTVTLTGDATVTVSSTATVTCNNANAFTSLANQNLTLQGGSGAGGGGTISGVLALGTGGLTKLQGGTWNLSGVNTYTGATTVS